MMEEDVLLSEHPGSGGGGQHGWLQASTMLTQPVALVAVLQPMGAERMLELLSCSV